MQVKIEYLLKGIFTQPEIKHYDLNSLATRVQYIRTLKSA